MQNVLDFFFKIFSSINPSILFLCVIFFGLYVFWRGAMETRKDRSSVFDLFIISVFLGLIISRIIYVLANSDLFSGYIWYWLPYERYGEEVYWFRLLPWRYLNIFDGGLDILVMFVGFLFSGTFWTVIVKKWRWNHLFPTIYFTGEALLALSFLLLGLSNANTTWIIEGFVLLVFPIISISLIHYVNRIEKPQHEKKVYLIANIIEIVVSAAAIAYIYLTSGINIYDKVTVACLVLWVFVGTIAFLRDSKKAQVVFERVSSVRTIGVDRPVNFKN